ncbi:MAG: Hsp70 family protein, partial [candidate division WOR-3 bacterium]
KEQSIRITASSGLSKEDVERAIKDAEAHAAEDRAKRELIDARNRADTLIYHTEKNLKEYGDKIPESEKRNIEDAINKLKESIKGQDKSAIERDIEALQKASYKLAEEMYRQAQAQKTTEQTTTKEEPKTEGKKVDADYQVYDDEKK